MSINEVVSSLNFSFSLTLAIVFLTNFISNSVLFYFVGTIVYCRINKIVATIIGASILAAVPILSVFFQNEPATYIISAIVAYIVIRLLYKANNLQACFISVLSCFFTICFTGMTIGLFSVLIGKNMYQVISISHWRILVLGMSAVSKTAAYIYCMILFSNGKGKTFLNSSRELKDVLYVHLCIMLFVLFYSYNYYYNLDLIWFSLAQIFMGAIMIVIYLTTLSYGRRVANLIEVDMRNKNISKQMENQLAQYNSYQKLNKDISNFKHKYGEFLLTAEYLIDSGDLSRLSSMFKAQEKDMERIIMNVRDFSNDTVCNSVLFALHSNCLVHNIDYEATVYVPENSTLASEVLRTSLYELSQFAMELIQKMPVSDEKFISFKSHSANNWLTIKMENSYAGKIVINHNNPDFIMTNSTEVKTEYEHIKDYIEKEDGMLNVSVDSKNKVLTTSISFYYTN